MTNPIPDCTPAAIEPADMPPVVKPAEEMAAALAAFATKVAPLPIIVCFPV